MSSGDFKIIAHVEEAEGVVEGGEPGNEPGSEPGGGEHLNNNVVVPPSASASAAGAAKPPPDPSAPLPKTIQGQAVIWIRPLWVWQSDTSKFLPVRIRPNMTLWDVSCALETKGTDGKIEGLVRWPVEGHRGYPAKLLQYRLMNKNLDDNTKKLAELKIEAGAIVTVYVTKQLLFVYFDVSGSMSYTMKGKIETYAEQTEEEIEQNEKLGLSGRVRQVCKDPTRSMVAREIWRGVLQECEERDIGHNILAEAYTFGRANSNNSGRAACNLVYTNRVEPICVKKGVGQGTPLAHTKTHYRVSTKDPTKPPQFICMGEYDDTKPEPLDYEFHEVPNRDGFLYAEAVQAQNRSPVREWRVPDQNLQFAATRCLNSREHREDFETVHWAKCQWIHMEGTDLFAAAAHIAQATAAYPHIRYENGEIEPVAYNTLHLTDDESADDEVVKVQNALLNAFRIYDPARQADRIPKRLACRIGSTKESNLLAISEGKFDAPKISDMKSAIHAIVNELDNLSMCVIEQTVTNSSKYGPKELTYTLPTGQEFKLYVPPGVRIQINAMAKFPIQTRMKDCGRNKFMHPSNEFAAKLRGGGERGGAAPAALAAPAVVYNDDDDDDSLSFASVLKSVKNAGNRLVGSQLAPAPPQQPVNNQFVPQPAPQQHVNNQFVPQPAPQQLVTSGNFVAAPVTSMKVIVDEKANDDEKKTAQRNAAALQASVAGSNAKIAVALVDKTGLQESSPAKVFLPRSKVREIHRLVDIGNDAGSTGGNGGNGAVFRTWWTQQCSKQAAGQGSGSGAGDFDNVFVQEAAVRFIDIAKAAVAQRGEGQQDAFAVLRSVDPVLYQLMDMGLLDMHDKEPKPKKADRMLYRAALIYEAFHALSSPQITKESRDKFSVAAALEKVWSIDQIQAALELTQWSNVFSKEAPLGREMTRRFVLLMCGFECSRRPVAPHGCPERVASYFDNKKVDSAESEGILRGLTGSQFAYGCCWMGPAQLPISEHIPPLEHAIIVTSIVVTNHLQPDLWFRGAVPRFYVDAVINFFPDIDTNNALNSFLRMGEGMMDVEDDVAKGTITINYNHRHLVKTEAVVAVGNEENIIYLHTLVFKYEVIKRELVQANPPVRQKYRRQGKQSVAVTGLAISCSNPLVQGVQQWKMVAERFVK
jgi:hypothetical protein